LVGMKSFTESTEAHRGHGVKGNGPRRDRGVGKRLTEGNEVKEE